MSQTSNPSELNPTTEDFAALLEESFSGQSVLEGTVVKGRVTAIENDLAFIIEQQNQKQIQSGIKSKGSSGEKLFKNLPLIVRYCNHDEVQSKRQKFLKFK